jgi:hypothetical protein
VADTRRHTHTHTHTHKLQHKWAGGEWSSGNPTTWKGTKLAKNVINGANDEPQDRVIRLCHGQRGTEDAACWAGQAHLEPRGGTRATVSRDESAYWAGIGGLEEWQRRD